MKSIKVCEYSRSRSFHYDLILQDQASGERSQDQWSSGLNFLCNIYIFSLAKEVVYYGKEAEREKARHDKMKGDGADEYQLKKQVHCCTYSPFHSSLPFEHLHYTRRPCVLKA